MYINENLLSKHQKHNSMYIICKYLLNHIQIKLHSYDYIKKYFLEMYNLIFIDILIDQRLFLHHFLFTFNVQ